MISKISQLLSFRVSKIANKRRPKKARPPYRRYVYKSSFTEENSSDEEEQENDIKSENSDDFKRKSNLNISSIYILTGQNHLSGNRWPVSQFEKIDVLKCCLSNGNENHAKQAIMADEERIRRERSVSLPVELIAYILEILYYRGHLKPRFLRVSKLFYNIAMPMLYRSPNLKAPNFFAFVDSISKNKALGTHIKFLDLSYIIQSGKNAFVAKLLKRSNESLEVFVAPQTSFGLGPLIALKNCINLRILDLRLVSETLNLSELFKSISHLSDLTKLSFPRSSIEFDSVETISWPPHLSALRISGGLSDDFLLKSQFPSTITQLEFAHCPSIKDFGLRALLQKFGPNLTRFKAEYPMPGLKGDSLDIVFEYCPNLTVLEIYVDYISGDFFDEAYLQFVPYDRPLRALYIESSGMLGTSTKLHPLDLALALTDGRLPLLKNIRCTAKLGWDPQSEYLSTIIEELEDRGGGLYLGY